jgi:hypothetical protein
MPVTTKGRGRMPVKERIRQILIKKPSARQSYKLAMLEYWLQYDGLA